MKIEFTIYGEAASKANSRKPAKVGKPGAQRTIWIKSDKARAFEHDSQLQIPSAARAMLTGPVFVHLRMFYATERPDLDEAVVLDVLQAKFGPVVKGQPRELIRRGVYINDRQVRKKLVEHFIDRMNPRTEIHVEPLQPQQPALIVGHTGPKQIRDARKTGTRSPTTRPIDESVPFG